jgi:hypothetical protein
MKKNNFKSHFSKARPQEYKISEAYNVRTTNINILLNRVKINKKKELEKKIIFSTLILLLLTLISFLFFN